MAEGPSVQEPDDSLLQEGSGEARQWCFGCGERNPEGLHIEFQVDGRSVTGRFTARQSHQGYPGVAHGGIAASILDEAMGWAMYAAGAWAMTARMQVKYRRPLPLAREVAVTAEVVRERGRWLEARAELRTLDGSLLAEAEGLFVRVPRERARRLQAFFTGRAAEPAKG
jgi:acyl-coenzyme A thioesterase PaaI-like protein